MSLSFLLKAVGSVSNDRTLSCHNSMVLLDFSSDKSGIWPIFVSPAPAKFLAGFAGYSTTPRWHIGC